MQAQDGQASVKRGRQARNTGASQVANEHIGERIRLRRTLLGLSQSELGKALGLSFQQMQKYERGASAIGAGQLCGIARALDVPVSFFYDGLDGVSVPPNSDARERRDRFARDELEVLGHYRAAPGFIQEAIRSLLGYLSNQGPGHDRDFAGDAAAKQEILAADSPPVNGMAQAPTRDGAGLPSMMEGAPGVDAGTDPNRQDVGELPESVRPESGQARSEPQEQPVAVSRPRGRPRKVVDTAQAEPNPARDRSGESAMSTPDSTPSKPRNQRGAVREPGDVVTPAESTGRLPAKSDIPRPDSRGGNKRTPGTRSASGPGRTTAKGRTPADGNAAGGTFSRADKSPASGKAEANRRSPRRAYGATWTPSDIGK
jgi:transcriptional regulator with XRE-family HTH domain